MAGADSRVRFARHALTTATRDATFRADDPLARIGALEVVPRPVVRLQVRPGGGWSLPVGAPAVTHAASLETG